MNHKSFQKLRGKLNKLFKTLAPSMNFQSKAFFFLWIPTKIYNLHTMVFFLFFMNPNSKFQKFALSSLVTLSFISCIISKTCHIAGLCSGDVKLQILATSVSIPSWLSSSASSSLIALTQFDTSVGTRNGCCDGCFPVKSSSKRMPKV